MGKIITKDKIPLNNTIKKISVIQIKKKNMYIIVDAISSHNSWTSSLARDKLLITPFFYLHLATKRDFLSGLKIDAHFLERKDRCFVSRSRSLSCDHSFNNLFRRFLYLNADKTWRKDSGHGRVRKRQKHRWPAYSSRALSALH